MPKTQLRYYLLLHVTIFIFGFTGILGKQISIDQPILNPSNVVLYRMLIAFLGLSLYMKLSRLSFKAERKEVLKMLGVGVIIAGHWITFFSAIEASNVSVALACLSSTALFTSFLEPLVFRKKINLYEIIIGIATIVGIYLIVKATSQESLDYTKGIVLSIVSAFLAAAFGVFNAKLGERHEPIEISSIEMISGAIAVFIFILVSDTPLLAPDQISQSNWWRLLVLGIVATSFAFVAIVAIMRVLSPFTVSLSINLEPIYAIVMALILFPNSEQMSPLFYVGTFIIMASIVVNALLKRKRKAV